MGSKIVHEKVMSVVYKEVKSIKHVSVIFEHWYFKSCIDNLLYFGFSLLLILDEFDAFLLFSFS